MSALNLTWRGLLSVNPAAFPLHEHFVNAATLATANNNAGPGVHFNASLAQLPNFLFALARVSTHV
jgi:hypothetical protein